MRCGPIWIWPMQIQIFVCPMSKCKHLLDNSSHWFFFPMPPILCWLFYNFSIHHWRRWQTNEISCTQCTQIQWSHKSPAASTTTMHTPPGEHSHCGTMPTPTMQSPAKPHQLIVFIFYVMAIDWLFILFLSCHAASWSHSAPEMWWGAQWCQHTFSFDLCFTFACVGSWCLHKL